MLDTNGMVTIDRPPTHTHRYTPAVSLVVDNSLQIFSLFDGYLGGVRHTPQVAFDRWDGQYIDKDLKKSRSNGVSSASLRICLNFCKGAGFLVNNPTLGGKIHSIYQRKSMSVSKDWANIVISVGHWTVIITKFSKTASTTWPAGVLVTSFPREIVMKYR